MDPTDPFATATDITDTGAVTDPAANPSNGLSAGDLLSQLIGTAGSSYVATQQSAAQVAAANAAAATSSQQPILTQLTSATGLSGGVLMLIGVTFIFLIAMRK